MLLSQHQLSGRLLELGITESVLMVQIEDNINLLRQLRALGIRIHTLKIDCAFIRDIESDSGSLAIVKAIISLAKTLQLHTVAEGIETPQQLNILQAPEVDEYQGFLSRQPEPAEQFTAQLRTKRNPATLSIE